MKRFSFLLFALLVLVVLCSMPLASCLSPPDIAFYPSKVTANASFVAIPDPHLGIGDDVVRVEWMVPTGFPPGEPARLGLFPKTGDQWMCYFSNTEPSSSCGPSPFIVTSQELGVGWQIQLTSVNQDGDRASQTLTVGIGGIDLTPYQLTVYQENRSVLVKIVPRQGGAPVNVTDVSYVVYYDNMTSANISGKLVYSDIGWWEKMIGLAPGDYFITFEAEKSGAVTDFGGLIMNVTISAEGIGPEDGYLIEADEISKKSVVLSSTTQTYSGKGDLTNIGNINLTNLTTSVHPDLSGYLTVTIDDTELLRPGESTEFRYSIGNLEAGEGVYINTFVNVSANISGVDTVVGEIKFTEIAVSVTGGAANPCAGEPDGTTCPSNGKCVRDTCIIGGFDCLEDDDCNTVAGEICSGLMCMSAGGCPSGETCYQGTSSDDCPGLTIHTERTCDYQGGIGVCCKPVDCLNDTQCSSPTPSCSGSPNYICVQCLTDNDCPISGQACVNNQCETQITTCPAGTTCFETSCSAGYGYTGYQCDLYGTLDGVCCEELEAPEGDMTFIFIVIIVIIIVIAVWYYFKKYKKGGGKGGKKRSKEEEELEKELEEEF